MVVDRPSARGRIHEAFSVHPAVALTGPRQSGKTTLAREIAAAATGSTFFDLESAVDRRRLLQAPKRTVAGLVVIDEIQREPALFGTLRVLVDRAGSPARFLLLGSASPALARGVSESLAGRVGLTDLSGFDLAEAGPENWRTLMAPGRLSARLPRVEALDDDHPAGHACRCCLVTPARRPSSVVARSVARRQCENPRIARCDGPQRG